MNLLYGDDYHQEMNRLTRVVQYINTVKVVKDAVVVFDNAIELSTMKRRIDARDGRRIRINGAHLHFIPGIHVCHPAMDGYIRTGKPEPSSRNVE